MAAGVAVHAAQRGEGGGIPELRSFVAAGGGAMCSIGAEGHAVDGVLVRGECLQGLEVGIGPPKAEVSVLAAAHQHGLARVPGHTVRADSMAGQGEAFVEVGGVEDADAAIAAGHGQQIAVGIEGEATHLIIR